MKSLTVSSNLSEIDKIRAFLKINFQGVDISDEDYYVIELSLLEICINIIRYAYPHNDGDISLKIWRRDREIHLEIMDGGLAFDPREAKTPDLENIMQSGRKGGLGIFLTRNLMDGIEYRREGGQNILTLTKKF